VTHCIPHDSIGNVWDTLFPIQYNNGTEYITKWLMVMIYFWLSADGKETLKKIKLIKYCTKSLYSCSCTKWKSWAPSAAHTCFRSALPWIYQTTRWRFLLLCSFQSTGMLYIHKWGKMCKNHNVTISWKNDIWELSDLETHIFVCKCYQKNILSHNSNVDDDSSLLGCDTMSTSVLLSAYTRHT